MPKRPATSKRIDANKHDRLIRYHLEEASVHLTAARLEIQKCVSIGTYHGIGIQFAKIGRYLKKLYVRHGGHPDA
jgi:hypothetical protein